MTALLSEAFNGATSGNVTTSNSSFDSAQGTASALQFTVSQKIEGSAMVVDPTAFGLLRKAHSSHATHRARMYVYVTSFAPTTSWGFWRLRDSAGTSTTADLRLTTTGFQLRNNGTGVSTFAPSLNTWYRIDIEVTAGSNTMAVHAYTGANLHLGTGASWSATGLAHTASTVTYEDVGAMNNGDGGLIIDYFDSDNSTLPAPYSAPPPPTSGSVNITTSPVAMTLSALVTPFEEWTGVRPVVTPAYLPLQAVAVDATPTTIEFDWGLKYYSGTLGAWVDMAAFFWNGSSWVPLQAYYADSDGDWVSMTPTG